MLLYEIHDLTEKITLAENLSFEELPELLQAYTDFYPKHNIICCYREYKKRVITEPTYQEEFIQYLEKIQYNIY